jgi:hypothetical protein
LHELFSQAPILGSLIDPSRLRVDLFQADYKMVSPLLSAVLKAEHATEETRERVIAAAGMVKAAALLAGNYTLVATNPPYLLKGKHSRELREFCEGYAPEAKSDLATVFVKRCAQLCSTGGTHATVTPQNWLFLGAYSKFRRSLLMSQRICHITAIGSGATATASWDVLRALVISDCWPRKDDYELSGIESDAAKEEGRALDLRIGALLTTTRNAILESPDCRFALSADSTGRRLAAYAESLQGLVTGDKPRFQGCFWEFEDFSEVWAFQQGPVSETDFYGGRERAIRWDGGKASLARSEGARIQGLQAIGQIGIAITQMRALPASLFSGTFFDNNIAVLVPKQKKDLLAIWAYCSSNEFSAEVRRIDKKLGVTNASLIKVPFDISHWESVASLRYPDGLPQPQSNNPTQWLFDGHPKGSQYPLQVAVSRLVGYVWPRQSGVSFMESPARDPDGLDIFGAEDGIVPLSSIAGEASAADRLRALLGATYGDEWSAAKLAELLGENESLETWLRNRFFEEHCQLFHQRPFVWHVWDGREDGFHALLNYHKLAAPNGEGHKILEKLIYTTLGDWITRQRADVAAGVEGADGRLAAAEHLKSQLEKILQGESPYDVFVRWKPLDQQPIGWEPDINDGMRMNIRPWLTTTPYLSGRRDGCILRVTPKIKYEKDRGKEPFRDRDDFPWFWSWDEKTDDFAGGAEFDGARWNDPHYSLQAKIEARNRKQEEQKRLEQASPARIGDAK